MKLLKFLKFLSVVVICFILLGYNSLGIKELRVCFSVLCLFIFVNDMINNHMKNKTNDVILNMSWQLDKIKEIIYHMSGIETIVVKDSNNILEYDFSYKYGLDKSDERSEGFIKEFTIQDIVTILNSTGGAKISNGELEIRYSDDSKLVNNYYRFTFNFDGNKNPIVLDGDDLSKFLDACEEFLNRNKVK